MKNGSSSRYISPQAHVLMMAAISPFVSGAISKTVNLPQQITEQEISDLFFMAWKLGLKSLAVYREDSKVGQPLNKGPLNPSLDPLSQVKCTDCGV
jgi:ribonucleoside-diphosphate reductase alpha chain